VATERPRAERALDVEAVAVSVVEFAAGPNGPPHTGTM
jgi:hypothetical protein